jgi:hypothetical protein
MLRITTMAVLTAGLLAGCASRSENITAAYVSPFAYDALNCRQLVVSRKWWKFSGEVLRAG